MTDTPKSVKRIKPEGPAWERLANREARSYVGHVRACGRCGYPCLERYCCARCGNGTPDTKESGKVGARVRVGA